MAKLDGFNDEALHPNICEALKVLAQAQAAFDKAVSNIDGQYLNSLDPSYAKQVAKVRALFKSQISLELESDGVKPKAFAG